MFLIIIIVLDQ